MNSASGWKTWAMMTWASTRCKRMRRAGFIRGFAHRSAGFLAQLVLVGCSAILLFGQDFSSQRFSAPSKPASEPSLTLRAATSMNVASEAGGAFMSNSKCDSDGNLYIRKFAVNRPMLGPVVKIDPDGKRVAVFDPIVFSELELTRADGFSPAWDGGLYQMAQSGAVKPRIYVLHYSSDGTAASPVRLDADLEVYTFAAFADGNFLVSGVRRDVLNKNDRGRNLTTVFSADGRELAELTFPAAPKNSAENPKERPAVLDLADAETGSDGNLYVMRASSPTAVYVIAPSGRIMKTFKVSAPVSGSQRASGFHLSGNQLAISFWNEAGESQAMVVADAQTGRQIASYAVGAGLGPAFACFSANEGVFTFLKLGEGNALGVIRADAQ
jgi:hypothetical protein